MRETVTKQTAKDQDHLATAFMGLSALLGMGLELGTRRHRTEPRLSVVHGREVHTTRRGRRAPNHRRLS